MRDHDDCFVHVHETLNNCIVDHVDAIFILKYISLATLGIESFVSMILQHYKRVKPKRLANLGCGNKSNNLNTIFKK